MPARVVAAVAVVVAAVVAAVAAVAVRLHQHPTAFQRKVQEALTLFDCPNMLVPPPPKTDWPAGRFSENMTAFGDSTATSRCGVEERAKGLARELNENKSARCSRC
jgi:hypothetical protein